VVNRMQGRCLSFDSKVGIGGSSADCSGGPRRAGGALQRAAEERRPRRTHARQCGRRRTKRLLQQKAEGFVIGAAWRVRQPPSAAYSSALGIVGGSVGIYRRTL
jgi:hypothetical protein